MTTTRRELFTRFGLGGLFAGLADLPVVQVLSTLAPEVSAPVVAATPVITNGSIYNALAAADAALFGERDEDGFVNLSLPQFPSFNALWDKYIRNHSPPLRYVQKTTKDNFLFDLYQAARQLFASVGEYSKQMEFIRRHPEETKNAIADADAVLVPYFDNRSRENDLLILRGIREFLADPLMTDEEKMEELNKYYARCGPSPFAEYPVNWDLPPGEVFREISLKVATLERPIEMSPASKTREILGDFYSPIHSFWDFLCERRKKLEFDEMYARHREEFKTLTGQVGISRDTYWHILTKGEARHLADWWNPVIGGAEAGKGNESIKFQLNPEDAPEDLVLRLCQSVRNMGLMFSADRLNEHPFTRNDVPHPNLKTYEEICAEIDGRITTWLPDFIADYFPQVWRALQNGQHEDIRKEANIDRSAPKPKNKEREEYYNRAWQELGLHGNDIY